MESIKHLKEELSLIEKGLNDPNYFFDDQAKIYWINRANRIKENINTRYKTDRERGLNER